MKLSNHNIIITGGSGLLGKSIVKHLIEEGATVINIDVKKTEFEHINLHFYSCDILNESELVMTFENILKSFKTIDGLINNAYPRTKDWGLKFEDIPFESLNKNLSMQTTSHFKLCQLAAEVMKIQKYGSIINIGSIYGIVGPDFNVYNNTEMTMPAAYSIIKGGMINFTRYLASYLGAFNIRVNCVSPGGIFDGQNPVFVKQYEEKVPMKRMGFPDDISPTVVFLLSKDSTYISGQNIAIDGGWTAI